jgi:hypothetical protein
MLGAAHETGSDASALELRQHRNHPQFSARGIGHAAGDHAIVDEADPALEGRGQSALDAGRRDAEAFELLERALKTDASDPQIGVAAAPAWWWTTLIGPVAITLLFRFASLPLIETRMLARRPAFAEHQQRAHNRTVDLMIARDCNGINAGSMLLRRSAWTSHLLERMWSDEWRNVPDVEIWWEQAVLMHLHATDADVRERTLFVPQRTLNAYPTGTRCGEGYVVSCC